ncbi:uncharacterized protein METZ01_LOCUS93325, partial [marine metagenome]
CMESALQKKVSKGELTQGARACRLEINPTTPRQTIVGTYEITDIQLID